MLPLTMGRPGETNVIQKITGRDSVRQRLCELGFVVGNEITIITKNGDNLVLSIKDCRMGLNAEMANRIMI